MMVDLEVDGKWLEAVVDSQEPTDDKHWSIKVVYNSGKHSIA